mgnify:CR=1 FL=1
MPDDKIRNALDQLRAEIQVDVSLINIGFLAYAAIGGVKKLVAFAQTKWAERKQKEQAKIVVDAEYTEIPDKREDSEEDASEEK